MLSRTYTRFAGWGLIGASVLGLTLWLPGFHARMSGILQDPAVPGLEAYLADLKPERAPWLTQWEGGRWGHYGWYLGPEEAGRLRMQLPGNSSGQLKLKVSGYDPGQLRVEIDTGGAMRPIGASVLRGDIVTVDVTGPSFLVVSAVNAGRADRLILESVVAAWLPTSRDLPPTWPLSFLIGMGQIGLLCLWAPRTELRSGLRHEGGRGRLALYSGCASLFLAAVAGFYLRWVHFDLARGLMLCPDVLQTWWPFARKFELFSTSSGFYSGAFREREPLYIAMLHYWLQIWGDSGPSVRLFTLCLSGSLVASVGYFVWGVSGRWWSGALGGWLVALNPEWIDLATQGLRDETTVLLLLAFLSVWLWGRGWGGAAVMGLSMGLLWLTRSPILSVSLPLMWGVWLLNQWRSRKAQVLLQPGHWTWRHLALASALAFGLYIPHILGVAGVHGDLSWQSSWQARWNANVEFPDRLGTPGWPTRIEFERDPYSGPRLTFGQYLFGLHSVPALIVGQLKGWAQSTVYMAASPTPDLKYIVRLFVASGADADPRRIPIPTLLVFGALAAVFLIGWISLLRNPAYQWIPVLCLWGTWYAAFMYGLRLIEPFRQTCHVYPLLLACQLWGGWVLLSRVSALRRMKQIMRRPVTDGLQGRALAAIRLLPGAK